MTTQTQIRVHELETELQKHKAVLKAEADAAEREKLRQLVKAGRAAKDAYDKAERAFWRLEGKVANEQNALNDIDVAIAEHHDNKPQIIDFPTPQEEAAWERRHEELQQLRVQQVTRLRDAKGERDRARFAAVKGDAVMKQAQQAVANLQARLAGEVPGANPRGGVSAVR
jgi:hypothetical protein